MKGHEDDGNEVPLRLPCYDFTPVADPTVARCLLKG